MYDFVLIGAKPQPLKVALSGQENNMIDEDTMKLVLDYNDKVDEFIEAVEKQHKIIADITEMLHQYLALNNKMIKELTPHEPRTNQA